jgi:hypothetical protein
VAALPERQDEIESVRGKEIATATYRDILPDGRFVSSCRRTITVSRYGHHDGGRVHDRAGRHSHARSEEMMWGVCLTKRPNQAMQLTASKPVDCAAGVCRRTSMMRFMHRGLAAADLVSR